MIRINKQKIPLMRPVKKCGDKTIKCQKIFEYFFACFVLSSFRLISNTLLTSLFSRVPHRSAAENVVKTLPVLCRRRFPGWGGEHLYVSAYPFCRREGNARRGDSAVHGSRIRGSCKQNKPRVPISPRSPDPLTRPLRPRAKTI